MLNSRFITLVLIILAAATLRLLPHPPNVTPIAAMALFGGAYFANRMVGLLVMLLAMVLSDLMLGLFIYDYGLFHAAMPFVYFSFIVTAGFGLLLRNRASPLRIGTAALSASLLFFVATNFGAWLLGNLYPMTLDGLIASYIAAIPFFGYTLAGNAFYTVLLFGGFAWAQRYLLSLRPVPAAVTDRPLGVGPQA